MSKRIVTLQSDEIDELLDEYRKNLDAEIPRYDKVLEFKTFLEDFDHHEQWYLETDLSSRTITWSYGLKKWLGYSKKEIEGEDIDHMKNYVHPFVSDWYSCFLKAMIWHFAEKKKVPHLRPRFVINIPVRHKEGHYLLVKQMTMPLGINESGKVVRFISSYSVFDEYKGEPLRPRIYKEDGKPEPGAWDKVKGLVRRCVKIEDNVDLGLGSYLMKVLTCIEKLKEEGVVLTEKSIMECYHKQWENPEIDERTINIYLSRLLEKLMAIMNKDALEDRGSQFFPDLFYKSGDSPKRISKKNQGSNQQKKRDRKTEEKKRVRKSGDRKRALEFFAKSGIIGVMLNEENIPDNESNIPQ